MLYQEANLAMGLSRVAQSHFAVVQCSSHGDLKHFLDNTNLCADTVTLQNRNAPFLVHTSPFQSAASVSSSCLREIVCQKSAALSTGLYGSFVNGFLVTPLLKI